MPPSETKTSNGGERQEATTKSGDITTLDFATFFDNESPQIQKKNSSETSSSEADVSQEEDTEEEISERDERRDTGDAAAAISPGFATFSLNGPTPLADVVKQIDNEKEGDGDTVPSKDEGYEPENQSSDSIISAEEGGAGNMPSFGEFVADFDEKDVVATSSTVAFDNDGKDKDMSNLSSVEHRDDENVVEHATSVEEAISEEENNRRGDDYRPLVAGVKTLVILLWRTKKRRQMGRAVKTVQQMMLRMKQQKRQRN